MRLPTRTSVATSVAAVLLAGGLSACGGGQDDTAAQSVTSGAAEDGTAQTPLEEGVRPEEAEKSAEGEPSEQAAVAGFAVKSSGNPFADARAAAGHMPMTAMALAGGIDTAAKLSGAADSKAAELRAHLAHLLTEHVYLAGIGVATAYEAGADSEEFKAAAATLDENSVDLAEAIGSVVPDEEENFLQTWREHINDFITYAKGAKTEGAAGTKMKKQALGNLEDYASEQGKFWNRITDKALPAAAVEKAFDTHIATLAAAIDAMAAGKANAYDKLKTAAGHMPDTAVALATGVDKATKMAGNPNAAAAAARAGLTHDLVEHVYLSSLAVFTAYTSDGATDSKAFKAAAATLDDNSVELADTVGEVAGKDNRATFLKVWRDHIGDFVTYAEGAAAGDQGMQEKALASLDDYRATTGTFFAKITKDALPAEDTAASLKTHIETLAGAIDSLAETLVKDAAAESGS